MAFRGLPPNNNKKMIIARRGALSNLGNNKPAIPDPVVAVQKIPNKVDTPKPQIKMIKPPNKIVKSWATSSTAQPIEQLTEHVHKLQLESFSTQQIDNIDEGDENQPQLVTEWVNEIYDYLRFLEAKFKIRPAYLKNNDEIRPRMRAILINWLVDVHRRFELLQETLYLAVAIVDRILQDLELNRFKLQLVGITALWIAAKYEEISFPELHAFISICKDTFSRSDVRQMECVILKQLDFSLGRPIPLHFLRRNSKAANASAQIHTVAKYLMELTLVHYDMVHHPPSLIAAAALCLTFKLLNAISFSWNPTLVHHSKYTEVELMPVMEKLARIAIYAEKSEFQAVREKYSSGRFGGISNSIIFKSDIIKRFAMKCMN
uniref:Uncharacterized protein n=1 Tax=Strigamia maritima TaxID=126957 RepID=T1JET8_STRMM